MAALLWLLIPLAAGVVASLWGGWAVRRRVIVPDAAGVARYARFCAAMERTHGSGEGAPGPEDSVSGPALPVLSGPGAREASDGGAREAR